MVVVAVVEIRARLGFGFASEMARLELALEGWDIAMVVLGSSDGLSDGGLGQFL